MISKEGLTHHISAQFNAELEEVRSHLLAMGGLVEKQVNDAVTALIEADSGLAQQVREIDDQINQMERNIDEECLRILARRQPAASDLRLIISISKSVIDLERIGDEATKIARRAIQLCEEGEAPRGYVEVRHIGDQVRNMVRDALDAFARFDAELALSVAQYDKIIDREYKTALRELATYMMEIAFYLAGSEHYLGTAFAGAYRRPRAQYLGTGDLPGTWHRRATPGSQAHEGRSRRNNRRNR